jgi:phosphatidate cytidylyltransferase
VSHAEAILTETHGMPLAGAALLKRAGSAVVAVPLLVWIVWTGPAWLFAALIVALAAAAAWELGRMFVHAGHAAMPSMNVVVAAVVAASFSVPAWSSLVLTLAVMAVMAALLVQPAPLSAEPALVGLLAIGYVGWLLGHALLLYSLPSGPRFVLFLIGVTWLGESAAYAVGSTIGRHRLAPVISPRKTIEGAVAQLVVSVLAALALGAWLLPDWAPASAMAAGAMLGIVGQVGDLAESVLKRALGTKDAGAIIPGHGGVLDRIDSLLFNVAALYYMVARLGDLG